MDDQLAALEGTALLLSTAGARVLTAQSAPGAREQLAADAPDVLLSDIGMPGQDGYALIRAIRSSGNGIPAGALTALARPEDRSRALLAGYTVHIAKPVDPHELVATVFALAKGGRAERSENPCGPDA